MRRTVLRILSATIGLCLAATLLRLATPASVARGHRACGTRARRRLCAHRPELRRDRGGFPSSGASAATSRRR